MSDTSPDRIGLKNSLLNRFTNMAVVQRFVSVTRAHKFFDQFLRTFPVTRRLPRSGLRYRITSYSAWLMAQEMFRYSVYRPAMADGFACSSFIDLGSHVGYFPLLLAEIFAPQRDPRALTGLCVDASPAMAGETAWHLESNGLAGITALHGLAGGGRQATQPFYLNSTSFLSSAFPSRHPEQMLADPLAAIEVPVLDVGKIWRDAHGSGPIDLLKIDIEGSELQFIEDNAEILAHTRRIIVECHTWLVAEDALVNRLAASGFQPILRLNEEANSVVRIFVRPD